MAIAASNTSVFGRAGGADDTGAASTAGASAAALTTGAVGAVDTRDRDEPGRWVPNGDYAPRDDAMLMYFLSTIDVHACMFERNGDLPEHQQALLTKIKECMQRLEGKEPGTIVENAAWTEAYRLERMMALLEPVENLMTEIQLRLDEAAAERVTAEPRLRATFTGLQAGTMEPTKPTEPPSLKPAMESALRALLLEILEELHWTTQRKFHARPIQKEATKRIVWAGVISFGLFILPYVFLYVSTPIWPNLSFDFAMGLPLWTALTAGLFGAYFSRLLFIQANAGKLSIGELKSARDGISTFLRGCVGMCGGLVVFFFLRSGIVDGNMFPDFQTLTVVEHHASIQRPEDVGGDQKAATLRMLLPSPALALLAVWCFLAGFSERLVPSILSSTEGTLEVAAQGKKK